MNVLIVQDDAALSDRWALQLQQRGHVVDAVMDQDSAVALLHQRSYAVVIMDVVLQRGSAMAVADYASFRHPDAHVIFVTATSVFSDGSIFQHCANACAFVPSDTPPEDLAAMVEYYAQTDQ